MTTGEITHAVRDTNTSIGEIVVGDWIGLSGGAGHVGGIVSKGDDIARRRDRICSKQIVGDEAELITIITGDGADGGTTAAIEGWLADHHGSVAREVQYGGQPLYPYLFGVE